MNTPSSITHSPLAQTAAIEPLAYTRFEATQRSRMSISKLDRTVKEGRLKPIRIGRKVLFPRAEFDAWCLAQRAAPSRGNSQ